MTGGIPDDDVSIDELRGLRMRLLKKRLSIGGAVLNKTFAELPRWSFHLD
jgi:hypothetical protein